MKKKRKEDFEKVFSGGDSLPDDLLEVEVRSGEMLVNVLIENKLITSKTEFSRLVEGGAVEIIGEGKITDEKIVITKPVAIRIGKHRFVKIVIS